MAKFNETLSGQIFIDSAASRETSPEIMEAIAFFARNSEESEAIWQGDMAGLVHLNDIWENVTGNGGVDATRFVWGSAGDQWAAELA